MNSATFAAFLTMYSDSESTINSKINGTPKGFYLPTSKLHPILAVFNLLAHNIIIISYYVRLNSLRLKKSVASKWASKNLWGTIYFVVDGTLKN